MHSLLRNFDYSFKIILRRHFPTTLSNVEKMAGTMEPDALSETVKLTRPKTLSLLKSIISAKYVGDLGKEVYRVIL
jgi:hypothetical protein